MSAHAGLLCTSAGHVFCPTWSILPLAMSWLYDIWYVLWYINSHTARKKMGESLCVSSKARVGWAVVLTRVEVPCSAPRCIERGLARQLKLFFLFVCPGFKLIGSILLQVTARCCT